MSTYIKLSPSDRCLLRNLSCSLSNNSSLFQQLLQGIEDSQSLQEGSVITGIEQVSLPYSIPDNVYNSFTIITSGSVSIDSVTVPEGTYTYSCGSNETLTGKDLANVSGGSVILLTQLKS